MEVVFMFEQFLEIGNNQKNVLNASTNSIINYNFWVSISSHT